MADELEMDDIEDGNDMGDIDDMDDMPDDLEDEQLFWSTNLKPDTDNDLSPPSVPGFVIHVTNASFGASVKQGSRTVVTTVNEEGQDVPLCVLLEGKHETHPLDLVISAAIPIKLQGKNISPVSLTGYISPPSGMSEALDMDEDEDEDLALEEAESSDDLKNLIRKRKLEAARGQVTGDEDDSKEPPNKRAKIDPNVNKNKPQQQQQQPPAQQKNKPQNPNQNQNKNQNPNQNKKNNNQNVNNKTDNKTDNTNVNANANANAHTNQPGAILSKSQKKKNKKNAKNAGNGNDNANANANTSNDNKKENSNDNNVESNNNTNENNTTKKEESENINDNNEQPTQSPKDIPSQSPKDAPNKKNDMMTMKGGIKYKDLKEGEGQPIKSGQKLNVFYVGQLADKQVFDKAITGAGFDFTFGKGQVIKGWDMGMNGMKVGGKRRIIVPANLAYGKEGNDNIPPNAELTFTVEVRKAQ